MTAIKDLRKEVKHYVDKGDEKSLRRVKAILEVDQEVDEDTGEVDWNDMPEELRNALDEANKECEEGKVIPHAQVVEQYSKWFRK